MESISALLSISKEQLEEGISALLDLVTTCLGDASTFDALSLDAIHLHKVYPILKGLLAGASKNYVRLIHLFMPNQI